MGFIDVLIIVLYLLGMFGVGYFTRKKIKSVDDFLVAGNRFKTFSLVGTIIASIVGAGTVLGIVGDAFQYGTGILWYFLGMAAGMAVFGMVFAGPLRKANKHSMAEIIAVSNGRAPRLVAGIIAAIYSFCLLAIGILGLSRMLVYVSGNAMSSTWATVIAMAVSIGLTALGGLYSVIWTDTIQCVIMIVMIAVVAPIVTLCNTNLSEINLAATSVGGTLTNPVRNVPVPYITLSFITLLLSIPGDPSVPQRALCGDSVKTVKRAFNVSAVITAIMGAVMTFVGCGIMAIMPDLESVYGTIESSFPIFIIQYFPPVLKGLGISALMAAVVSTVTSMLLVGTTHLVYDAGQALFPKIPNQKFKAIMPIAIVIVGVVITWISLSVQSIVNVLYFAFSVCGGALVMPMFFVLYWKKTSGWGVTIGMLLGLMYVLAVQFLGWTAPGGDSVYVGLLLSVAGTVVGSLLLPEKTAG